MENIKGTKRLRLSLSLVFACTLLVSTPANAFFGFISDWAMEKINESWPPVNVLDQQRKAIDHSSLGLVNMDTPSVSVVLSKKEITELIVSTIEIASRNLPAKVTNVELSLSEQSIQFSGDFSGRWEEKGVDASGRVAGNITFSLDDKNLVLSPTFRSIKIEELEVDGWWWLPNSIAGLVSPLLSTFIENINGQIKPKSIDMLSELTKKSEIINLGDQTLMIPKLTVVAASLLVNQEHISVLLELNSKPNLEVKKLDRSLKYTEFEKAYLSKADGLVSSPPTTGVYFSQSFLSAIFGDLALFGSDEERQQLVISKTIKNLKQIRGPDFVLRVSSSQVDSLIIEQLKESVQEMEESSIVVKSISHQFNFGSLELNAEIEGEFTIGENNSAIANLFAAIQVATYIDSDGESLLLLPSVSGLSIKSLSLRDASVDLSQLTLSINSLLVSVRDSVNRIVPEIPIRLPAVLPEKHELTPIKFAGGTASFTPRFFTPPRYELERGVFYFSEQGLWVLVDFGIPELPDRPLVSGIGLNSENTTSKELDEAINKLIEKKIGGLAKEDIYAFSSWKRFAELFNFTWQKLSPKVSLTIDSGNQKMENQEINLLEHSRLECKRNRTCKRKGCSQKRCEFKSCSKKCKGNEFARIYCKARNAKCDIAANASKAACDTKAVAAKADCDVREEAAVFDCNRLAEQEVAGCKINELFINLGAEISGVGNIGGDARLSGNLKIDASRFNFNPDKLQVQFLPHVSGNLRADIGLDWTPYDLIGHAFCPTRGRVNANSTATFNDARPSLKATLLKEGQAEDDGDPDTVDLGIKFSKTRFPVTISPGLLHSLYQRNPQIIITCPVSNLLTIPALAFNGTNKAIGENDIARAVSNIANPGLIAYSALHDAEPEAMGTLFGGSFYIEIEERTQPLPVSKTTITLPGGEVTFRPTLHEKGFLLSATVK